MMEQRCSRRDAAKLGLAAAIVGVVGMARPGGASAGRTWCRKDPVIKVGGATVDILLSSDWALNDAATGPAEIVVTTAPGVPTELLAVDLGWGGWGYTITFEDDPAMAKSKQMLALRVQVYVPSRDDSLPLVVDVKPRSSDVVGGQAQGMVNKRWVTVATR